MDKRTEERRLISLVKDENAYNPSPVITKNDSDAVWDSVTGTIVVNGVHYTVAEYIRKRNEVLRRNRVKHSYSDDFIKIMKWSALFVAILAMLLKLLISAYLW